MFKDFYRYYQVCIPMAYLSGGAIDFIDHVKSTQRNQFEQWIINIRMRGEKMYKEGEELFIPRITRWLHKTCLKEYTPHQLLYVQSCELQRWINKKSPLPTTDELDERHKWFYARYYPVARCDYLSGKCAQRIITQKRLLVSERKKHILKKVKGISAFHGIVQGRVRIIRSSSDMREFKTKEIIVSQMTQPSYLPIIKRARALVTDEGGVLCHAAIVSRELKKPCIIGTKIATKVFKDGDKVSVDANKGIVRKL